MSNKYNNNGTPMSGSSSSSSSNANNNNDNKSNNKSKNHHRPVLLLLYLLLIGIAMKTKESNLISRYSKSNTMSNMSLEQKVEQTLAEDTTDDKTITTDNNNEEEDEVPITVTAEAAAVVVPIITQVAEISNNNKNNEVPPLRPNNKYNPSWLVVSHSKKLAITIIPKVMCSTIRDAFNNKLEHCGLPTPITPEPPVPSTNTNTDTTHHPVVVVVDSVVDSDSVVVDSNSDSFTEQQPQIGGYNNNTLPLKILQTIPLKEQMQLKTLKRRMIQRFQEKNVIGRCTEARRNPELRYNHSMYLTENHYTTVLIVRDPFERAYSAYKNSDSNTDISLNDGIGGSVCSNTTNCTFEVWVNKLIHFRQSNNSAVKNNEHFKTQSEIAQFHKMHYHYKLRMTSQIDLTFLFQDLMGFKNGIPKEHINNSSSSSSSKNNTATGSSSSSSSSSKRNRSGRLQQQKDNNNVTITTTTTTTTKDNNNSDRILKLFESISSKTMNQLAIFYKNDLKLWQELLDYGTPRSSSPGEEITLYDYYISDQNQKKMITT